MKSIFMKLLAAFVLASEASASKSTSRPLYVGNADQRPSISRSDMMALKKKQREMQSNKGWLDTTYEWMGLAGVSSEQEMSIINLPATASTEQALLFRMKYGEAGNAAWAVFDTSLTYTVINCEGCTSGDSATGMTITDTSVTGSLNNPETSYSGYTGTATVCIIDEDSADDAQTPDTATIAAEDLLCAENVNVHWATDQAGPSSYNEAVAAPNYYSAYIGIALGDSATATSTPSTDDFLLNQFVSYGTLDTSTKKLGFAVAPYDGDDNVEDTSNSIVDVGALTYAGVRSGADEKVI